MAAPTQPTLMKGFKRMTCPVIIMRHGGLDGVALQKHEYRALLNEMGIFLHVITGREEKEYSSIQRHGQLRTIIRELDFFHADSKLLYGNAFRKGSETEGIEEISATEWIALYDLHRKKIRDQIERVLLNVPDNTPVIIYNLISLRHLHPAAAGAIRELIEKYPNRGFLSHSADPDAERPERISRLKSFVLERISAHFPDSPYSGGPYKMDNLYHIVLNPTQKKKFLEAYDIPQDHIFEIPDFLEFKSEKACIQKVPQPGFMDFLCQNSVYPIGETYCYQKKEFQKNQIFFLSPVRPIKRKRLKEAMTAAFNYGRSRKKEIAFIVTHPDIDDRPYFVETVRFAASFNLQYIHLGKNFSLEVLNYVYTNLSSLPTIGVIASSAGGWENALNEMANACIPFFMSNQLNSFEPISKKMGIKTYGMDFHLLEKMVDRYPEGGTNLIDIPETRQMGKLFTWIDSVLDKRNRKSVVEHNYQRAYQNLSSHTTAVRLWRLIWKIYAMHTLKPQPGEAGK